jgi:hypothetical protein
MHMLAGCARDVKAPGAGVRIENGRRMTSTQREEHLWMGRRDLRRMNAGVFILPEALRGFSTSTDLSRLKHRPRCGAKTRAGGRCLVRVELGKARCRFHGGLSTGPKTGLPRPSVGAGVIIEKAAGDVIS